MYYVDTVKPILLGTYPYLNQDFVPTNVAVELYFSEPIMLESGALNIHLVSDNSLVQSIPFDELNIVNNQTIKTSDLDLSEATEYYITIENSLVADVFENLYDGITGSTFNFTTIDSSVLSTPNIESDIMSISPNPVTSVANINFNRSTNVENIQVFDANGRSIRKKDVRRSVSNYEVNFEGLTSGIYFLRIQTDTGVLHKKMIKN